MLMFVTSPLVIFFLSVFLVWFVSTFCNIYGNFAIEQSGQRRKEILKKKKKHTKRQTKSENKQKYAKEEHSDWTIKVNKR